MSGSEHIHKHDSGCRCECGLAHDYVSVKLLESAIVGTVKGDLDCDINTAMVRMRSAFKLLIDYANEQRALIGHIKGFFVCGDTLLTFSTTGGDITVTQHDSTRDEKPNFSITAILFNIDIDSLKAELIEVFHAIISGKSL
jgi:hypothetical protein